MLGVRRRDLHVAERGGVACRELHDVVPSPPAQQLRAADRDEDAHRAAEPLQRRQVEVVVVQMREEHRVDIADRAGRAAHAAEHVHAVAQHGVGHETRPVQLDDDGAVADPDEPHQWLTAALSATITSPSPRLTPTATTVPPSASRSTRAYRKPCTASTTSPAIIASHPAVDLLQTSIPPSASSRPGITPERRIDRSSNATLVISCQRRGRSFSMLCSSAAAYTCAIQRTMTVAAIVPSSDQALSPPFEPAAIVAITITVP